MMVELIKMDFLHKRLVVLELLICIYISSSAIVRIREHVKQVESVHRANKYILEINIDTVKTCDKLKNKHSKSIQLSKACMSSYKGHIIRHFKTHYVNRVDKNCMYVCKQCKNYAKVVGI